MCAMFLLGVIFFFFYFKNFNFSMLTLDSLTVQNKVFYLLTLNALKQFE